MLEPLIWGSVLVICLYSGRVIAAMQHGQYVIELRLIELVLLLSIGIIIGATCQLMTPIKQLPEETVPVMSRTNKAYLFSNPKYRATTFTGPEQREGEKFLHDLYQNYRDRHPEKSSLTKLPDSD